MESTSLQTVPTSQTELLELLQPTLLTLGLFVGTLVALLLLGRVVVRPLVGRTMRSAGLDETLRSVLTNVLNVVVAVAALGAGLVAAGFAGVLAALLTTGGAVAIILAFVAREPLASVAAGFFILTERPFEIGDWIEWGDHRGVVKDIGLRVTRVRTFDNQRVTVPNTELTDTPVRNPVAYDTRRIAVDFSIDYDDDIKTAREIGREVAASNDEVADDPAPEVVVRDLEDSRDQDGAPCLAPGARPLEFRRGPLAARRADQGAVRPGGRHRPLPTADDLGAWVTAAATGQDRSGTVTAGDGLSRRRPVAAEPSQARRRRSRACQADRD